MRASRLAEFVCVAIAMVLAVVCCAPDVAAAEKQTRYAIVIGHNQADSPDLATLRYADDDAIRTHQLLALSTDASRLLVAADEETRRLYGVVGDGAPSRSAVMGAFQWAAQTMEADRKKGILPTLYVVYTGHGSYDDRGRGFVYLTDGVLTTLDLYRSLFDAVGGSPVVLMVDACNAAMLVRSRGPGSTQDRRKSQKSVLRLEDYPNVGVILSSSGTGEVHEWGRYLGGVFSHEVRSALMGPGDLDGDGAITFAELATFVEAANDAVDNPGVRLQPYIRPPLGLPNFPVVDLRSLRFPVRISIPNQIAGRGHVVDHRLVRYADFFRESDQPFSIGIPRLDGPWVVVIDDTEWVVPKRSAGTLDLSDLESRPRTTLTQRSATSEYLENTLFSRPLTREFASRYLTENYVESLTVVREVPDPWYHNALGWSLVGSGALVAGAGVACHVLGLQAENDARTAKFTDDRDAANGEAYRYRVATGVLYGVGAAAVVGGVTSFLLDPPSRLETYSPPLRVDVGPAGITLSGSLPR